MQKGRIKKFFVSAFILAAGISSGFAETYCNTLLAWNDVQNSHYGTYTKDDTTQIVTDKNLNVRSGPDTNYEKLFQLNAGNKVVVLEKTDATFKAEGAVAYWYKIECDKGSGYLCARWLSNNWAQGDIDGDGDGENEYLAVQFFNNIPPECDHPEDDGYSCWISSCMYIDDEVVSIQKEVPVDKERSDEILGLDGFYVVENAGLNPAVSVIAVMSSAHYGAGFYQEIQLYYYKPESKTFEKITQFHGGWEGYDGNYATVYFPSGRLELFSEPVTCISSEHGERNHLLINKRHFKGGLQDVPSPSDNDENEDWIWNGEVFLRNER